MRLLTLAIVSSLVPPSIASACQPQPPMRSELVLLTAKDATLPADGAILVSHRNVPADGGVGIGDGIGDASQWTVTDGSGASVKLRVEDLGSGIERWVPASAADRELVILDAAHKQVATLHQTKARRAERLPAPVVRSLRSTTTVDQLRSFRGIAGGTSQLVLSSDPPTSPGYLVVGIAGATPYAHAAIAPASATQRTFEETTYARKSCAPGGPGPLLVGQRVRLSWVDELGRRSSTTEVTVSRLPQQPTP